MASVVFLLAELWGGETAKAAYRGPRSQGASRRRPSAPIEASFVHINLRREPVRDIAESSCACQAIVQSIATGIA